MELLTFIVWALAGFAAWFLVMLGIAWCRVTLRRIPRCGTPAIRRAIARGDPILGISESEHFGDDERVQISGPAPEIRTIPIRTVMSAPKP
ncbi:hypothetical protein ACFORG_07565 [Lutimaribacter marinistellae]|uniref:NfeD-like C-terminal domain-containing protein n=1 Tax=Lutimaribacter marinistellae TaxID=1820329 RepID=A0ABV7TII6_9RHOB